MESNIRKIGYPIAPPQTARSNPAAPRRVKEKNSGKQQRTFVTNQSHLAQASQAASVYFAETTAASEDHHGPASGTVDAKGSSSLWNAEDHSPAANDAMVAKLKGYSRTRNRWQRFGMALTRSKALFDFSHRPGAGTLAAAAEEEAMQDLFTKVLLPKVQPRRFGELVVKVEETTKSEARRERWQKAAVTVATETVLIRPPSPLNSKTARMWSESGEVPVSKVSKSESGEFPVPCTTCGSD